MFDSIEDGGESKEDGDIMEMESEQQQQLGGEEVDMSNGAAVTAMWSSIDTDNNGESPLPTSHLHDGRMRTLSQNESAPGSCELVDNSCSLI